MIHRHTPAWCATRDFAAQHHVILNDSAYQKRFAQENLHVLNRAYFYAAAGAFCAYWLASAISTLTTRDTPGSFIVTPTN